MGMRKKRKRFENYLWNFYGYVHLDGFLVLCISHLYKADIDSFLLCRWFSFIKDVSVNNQFVFKFTLLLEMQFVYDKNQQDQ